MVGFLPLLSCESSVPVKENLDGKKYNLCRCGVMSNSVLMLNYISLEILNSLPSAAIQFRFPWYFSCARFNVLPLL